MTKDWTGNSKTVFSQLGSSNHSEEDRELNDYYATEPKALELLLQLEKFNKKIWEPACGGGHLSKVLISNGYKVLSTDLIDRGYGHGNKDFLSIKTSFPGDIITNPPYKFAQDFVEHSLELIQNNNRVAMFLKLQFLEGQKRKKLFKKYPLQILYVSSGRLGCIKNGDYSTYKGSAVAYGWFIWQKGFAGDSIIKWFN